MLLTLHSVMFLSGEVLGNYRFYLIKFLFYLLICLILLLLLFFNVFVLSVTDKINQIVTNLTFCYVLVKGSAR